MCVRNAYRSGCKRSGVFRAFTRCGFVSLIALAIALPCCAAEEKAPEKASSDKASSDKASSDKAAAEKAATEKAELAVRMIGATALVTEMSTGLPLPARVDTGATSCSIHCAKFEIKDAAEDPKTNIGKLVRFLIQPPDSEGEGEWVESKIVDHVRIRTAEREDERYKVQLKLRVDDVEKKVLVTLNDRENMKYPVLLGRNFLRDDFLVNVALDGEK
jgi:hypothetical protein